jgi:hypothetical protein
MNTANACSCCSKLMLRHINRSRTYWFCRSCWQEMPLQTLAENKERTPKKNYHLLIEKNALIRVSL